MPKKRNSGIFEKSSLHQWKINLRFWNLENRILLEKLAERHCSMPILSVEAGFVLSNQWGLFRMSVPLLPSKWSLICLGNSLQNRKFCKKNHRFCKKIGILETYLNVFHKLQNVERTLAQNFCYIYFWIHTRFGNFYTKSAKQK